MAVMTFGDVRVAHAGLIVAVGDVQPLRHVDHLRGVIASGEFTEGPLNAAIPADLYAAKGMTFHTGTLVSILPGVTTPGSVLSPRFNDSTGFTEPIGGGGKAVGFNLELGAAVQFADDLPVTQVGLTISFNGAQYITAWDKSGVMLGQVRWEPDSDSAFFGIDTLGVPIGLVTLGNDDLWGGEAYVPGGYATHSDTWMWATGTCVNDGECANDNLCDGIELCVAGLCQAAAAPLDCDDLSPCTLDSCHNIHGCLVQAVDGDGCCEADDACEADELCDLDVYTCAPADPPGTDSMTEGTDAGSSSDTSSGDTTDTGATAGETDATSGGSTSEGMTSGTSSGTTDGAPSGTASGSTGAGSEGSASAGGSATDSEGAMTEGGNCACRADRGPRSTALGMWLIFGFSMFRRRASPPRSDRSQRCRRV